MAGISVEMGLETEDGVELGLETEDGVELGLETEAGVELGFAVELEIELELVDGGGPNVYTSSLLPAPQNSEKFPAQVILQSPTPPGESTAPFPRALSQKH